MKISIVTATNNSEKFILTNLNSITNQSYKNYEHIIVDNKSNDETISIIKQNAQKFKIISEKDQGIYDAFNKGIKLCSGDIISILNSDDFFAYDQVLEDLNTIFMNNNVDIVYGNLKYVKRNTDKKFIRYWKSKNYIFNDFKKGWSPPHPSFFVKKEIYEQYGYFKLKYGNASDFELMFRFLEENKLRSYYFDKTLVIMRTGGKSNKNLKEIIRQNIILLDILNINKNLIMILKFLFYKFFNRIKQYIFLK